MPLVDTANPVYSISSHFPFLMITCAFTLLGK